MSASDLLTPDGMILVSINDENRARLELLLDEVFPGWRLGTMTWRTQQGSNADQQCFLSVDHEHVLVYGNAGFSFNGFSKSYEMYGNPDNDPRGDWRTSDLTLGFSYKERPNLYYPLLDQKTGITYPPNPDRVWVYASEARLKEGQTLQAKTMEAFIELGQIIFPAEQRVETWPTLDALLAAIDAGDVPKSGKTPLLRRDLPNLEFWVGKPVGFGRPKFKRYKADLRNQTQPLSSWITPSFEEGSYEAETSFVSSTNQEGARLVETKENVKDAARKARRVPRSYGKVLFLTKDQSRLRVINDDGSLGLTVDWDDLTPVREWLRNTRPMTDHGLDQRVSR